jgi:hypothetical protein
MTGSSIGAMLTKTTKWIIVCAVMAVVLLLLVLGKGEHNRTYEGTLERGFEVSAFYPNGSCSAGRYWFVADEEASREVQKRWSELGRPGTLRVKFVGDLTRLGEWGHLGAYRREIRAHQILEVSRASGSCD